MDRVPFWLAPVLSAAVFAWRAIDFDRRIHGPFLIDDAYISLRHAWNFVQGHGFNFNPGERVEGYTNFLYTLLMSLAFPLGIEPEAWIKAIGIAAGMGLVTAIYLMARPLLGRPAAAILSLTAGWDPRLAEFSTWGLEIVFCPMLYAFAFHQLFRNRTGTAALLFALAAMTRIETALMAAIGFSYLVLLEVFPAGGVSWDARRWWSAARRPLVFGGLFAGIFGTYFVSRLLYYGQLFPNTYYAKVGSAANSYERGLEYVASVLDGMGVLQLAYLALVSLPFGLCAFFWRGGRRNGFSERQLQRAIVLFAGTAYLAYVVRVGGDHFRERFIYHVYPLVVIGIPLAFAEAVKIVVGWIPRSWLAVEPAHRYAAVALLAAAMFSDALTRSPTPDFQPFDGVSAWASLGDWLKEQSNPEDYVATTAAGALPHYSGLRAIDVHGLADLHIAHLPVSDLGRGHAGHEKRDPVYVIDRQPRFVSTWVKASAGFLETFGFRDAYQIRALLLMDSDGIRTSPEKVLEIPPGTTPEQIRAWVDEGYRWGLWEREASGGDGRVELRHTDLRSRLHDPIPARSDGILLEAPKGHPPAHILYGPYFHFSAGSYRWDVHLHMTDLPEADERLCLFEATLDPLNGSEVLLKEIGVHRPESETGDLYLSAAFDVPEGANRDRYSIRLGCDGRATVQVRSVTVTRTEGAPAHQVSAAAG